ncbi:PREDICTED: beta-fructofuranosidase [Prunus dulcis]|uniref:PREDICTED: beta-fructofuranosidase n=1 Tax=Prunus dulcis TaxID=3755 RepID=A0A5E4EIL5_PRUDU|nr:beta-fructofuranosidase, insoluble isoenzyme 3-like [Prunus dulcis]VVA15474.1 PREDICTED: beta-fructofuranosidase [Prunus dulcis]
MDLMDTMLNKKLGLVFVFAASVFLVINNNGVEASHNIYSRLQNAAAVEVKQLHRTGYHFQPPKHWINDPNAPMYFNGIYHLFYQYNPRGAVWGNIVWAHSVSKDLINWEALPPAIYPSKPFDINGTWSGSATILPGNKPIILYTGLDADKRQIQNYAVPANYSDPFLREWIKPDDNPLVVPSQEMNSSQFRDPTTAWWHNGHWRILVGGKRKHRGMAWLYRSIDFKYWVKAKHPLHSAPETGMWECPDFFPLALNGRSGVDTSKVGEDVKHILKVSLDETRYEYYTLGKYFPEKDRYVPDNTSVDGRAGLRLDYGNFYASKTFFDPSKNMRILWGWANESDAADDDKAKGWAGVQTIPRVVWLSPDAKQVVQWPIKELETLRGQKVDINNQNVEQGQHVEVKGITAAQADVEVTFSFGSLEKAEEFDPNWANLDAQTVCSLRRSDVPGGIGPFGLLTLASQNLEEFTPVFFRVFKTKENKHKVLMCSDAKSSSLRPFNEKLYRPSFAGFVDVDLSADKKISLRSLIDHSVVESFGAGGKTCITSRVYPTLAVNDAAHLFVFNNGIEPVTVQTLSAWSMNAPQQMNQNLEF